MRNRSLAICMTVFTAMSLARIASADDIGKLVKVKTNDFRVIVGELKKEDGAELTIADLSNGHEQVVEKVDIKSVERDLNDDQAVGATNLPTVLGWKISKLQRGSEKPVVGKVARISDEVVYLNLGGANSLAIGDHLSVFRNQGEVKDPDTGKILGSERSRIAEIELTEVKPGYSKGRKTGNLEIKLQVGDEVEAQVHSFAIAVFPPVDFSGNTTEGGTALAEELTTKMVSANISVVERARLSAVLTELAIQSSALFEPETAQKVGHQIGATAVLTGKIVAGSGRFSEANMRLIDVTTGRILLAATTPLRSGAVIDGGAAAPPGVAPGRAATNSGGSGRATGGGAMSGAGRGNAKGAGPAASDGVVPYQVGNAPIDDKVVAQEEKKTNTGGGYNPHVYKLEVPVNKPKVPLLSSTISLKMVPGKKTDGMSAKISISVDYGKTFIEIAKFDQAIMSEGHRAGDWYHIPLATAGVTLNERRSLKDAAGDVDQIRVKVDGGATMNVLIASWEH
jgi:hypothetical protein